LISSLSKPSRCLRHIRLLSAGTIWLWVSLASGQRAAIAQAQTPTSEQIVDRMVVANMERVSQLAGYTAERHYTVSYRGFPAPLSASMVVEVTFAAPSTKSFRVVSHTGTKLLFDEVLSKLLKSEEEAARNPSETALTPDNYQFTLVGEETIANRQFYVLRAEPKSESRFLYRGKVWVDAKDYAVTQIEAEPAKNPSFWIKDTKVHHVYAKTAQFWLPANNRSETVMRFGGTAVLTIDYGTYKVQVTAPR
jgi:MucB/RseB N-terminal domain